MKKRLLLGILLLSLVFIAIACTKKSNSSDTSGDTAEYTSKVDTEDVFTDRDLEQEVDTSDATSYTVSDNKTYNITEEGIYTFTGSAKNVTITVSADKEAKVQLVLNNLTITNTSTPAIYVKSADKVFVTTTGTNSLSVTGTFVSDGDTNTDAVIFSKDDVVLNGTGTLTISSTDNGITSKDDLKITGGTININCVSDALEANDSVAISDGNITINSKKDGIHVENEEDNTTGYVYIQGGTLSITASDDGIHATTTLQIDDGTITIKAAEGLEATVVQINGGTININASDDGINAAIKSTISTPTVEINGGNLTISMGQGDTDAIDSNGNIYINGGTITITAQSPFDYDNEAKYTGGKMIINGTETTTITNQMMGGGQRGNQGGNQRGGYRR